MDRVLIAIDEEATRLLLRRLLRREGFDVIEASNGKEAVDYFRKDMLSCVVLDLKMPVRGCIEIIDRLKGIDASVPIIVVAARSDIPNAADTIETGAYDFLARPAEPAKLVLTVKRGVEKLRLEKEVKRLHRSEDATLERTFGGSHAIKNAILRVKHAAATDLSVIIEGETGTGKTFLAKALHNMSRRAGKSFVKIDMGAIPTTLIESELFGYEKGAFTGAAISRKGFFETADGGSIFIDELENTTPMVQSKLLSAVDDKAVYRIGGRKPTKVDVRIIAATSADIQESLREGKFREDLFYRMGEFVLRLPPLRERVEDIPFFARKFLEEYAEDLGESVKAIDPGTMDYMMGYHWPGNIRELKNAIRRAAILSGGGIIRIEHLDLFVRNGENEKDGDGIRLSTLKDGVSTVEKKMIRKALDVAKNNKALAASMLRIDVKTLRSKMMEYDIDYSMELDLSSEPM